MTQRITKGNDLKQLRFLLTQDEEGLKKYVYDKLTVGDAWWIPNTFLPLGERERHPWIVVTDYSRTRPPILACPRTTQLKGSFSRLRTPANLLPGLDKEGELLWDTKRAIPAYRFRDFDYIGRLSEEWIAIVRNWIERMAGSKP